MAKIFPLLYWIGLLIALCGLAADLWLGYRTLGSGLALAGLALLLAARAAQALRRPRRKALSDQQKPHD